ncbi:pyridoxal phosphate-dependent class II aminotransferase [Paenibacillus sp. P26]|nr:pyridoxal phosphate-dependent class II aminotransferase [Paenibacillus sp. P26]
MVHYPDPAVRELTAKLAAKHGVPAECVLVGNGAAELIDLAVRILEPKVTGLARPSFAEYEEAVRKIGGQVRDIPLREETGFRLSEGDIAEATAVCDLLMLGHPNNPTGRSLGEEMLERLAAVRKPVIVDEAFLDFSPEEERLTLTGAAAVNRRLIVIRSMTKFYSIPGLRLGYAVAHPDRIARMKRPQVPWSVNALAQWIGSAVLEEHAFAAETKKWLPEEREWLSHRLRRLGLKVYDSDVNFLLLSLEPLQLKARELQEAMGRQGVLIRDASRFPGLSEAYVRVAVKTREQNERLANGLASVIEMLKSRQTVSVSAEKPAAVGEASQPRGTATASLYPKGLRPPSSTRCTPMPKQGGRLRTAKPLCCRARARMWAKVC